MDLVNENRQRDLQRDKVRGRGHYKQQCPDPMIKGLWMGSKHIGEDLEVDQ